ncbi:MAG: glycogen-debranching protein [Verrucomicrobia bacterium]|nr:glycogen-debranching protein [Verrucomicrobiota bacterium]
MRSRLLLALLASVLLSVVAAIPAAEPLGARFDAAGEKLTFRVYSGAATRIEVWIYDAPIGQPSKVFYELEPDAKSKVWSRTVSVAELREKGVTGTVYYGYRAWGPNWPYETLWRPGTLNGRKEDCDSAGNRFNPNKLLLDPCALEVSHDACNARVPSDAIFTSGTNANLDTGVLAPKSIALPPLTAYDGPRPTRAFKDDIVYEVHLRGLTKADPTVPEKERGTYAGAARKAAYLAGLGITAVEFLPLAEFQNEQNDTVGPTTRGMNYWGYSPNAYFAPERRYALDQSPGGPTREFREMVRAFHAQGLKVFVDVVYNHTGEGGVAADGKTARLHSFRGLDNAAYYQPAANARFYQDNNGVGPNLNAAHPAVRDLIVDSLRHWREVLGVDGFRFDLAPVLGNARDRDGFQFSGTDPANALNRAVRELPARPAAGGPGVDLIAEPWALGNGTYQVGHFPAGWAEWNDKFRDAFRRSQNKLGVERIVPAELARRLTGSPDLFQDDGRRPAASVNFIVCHDGFTLADLYRYNAKRNGEKWPYGPSDGGSDHNLSWNQGGDPALQRQAARNGLALTLLSVGVPLFNGGDEMLRTQFGNNNTYNLDSEANWLDWTLPKQFPNFAAFARKLLAFRRTHAILRPADWFSGRDGNGNGLPDLSWYTAAGREAGTPYLDDASNTFLGWILDGTETEPPGPVLYCAYHWGAQAIEVVAPPNSAGKRWHRVLDTRSALEPADNIVNPGAEEPLPAMSFPMAGRSVVVLLEK